MSEYTQEELSTKNLDELKEIAKKLKIKSHPSIKEANLIKKILQQPQAYVRDAMKHQAETPVAPVDHNTPEEVMEVIKTFAEKPGFEVEFPEDGTWIFRYRGAEESGNLAIPIRVIKQKAMFVARGRRALMGLGKDNTYKGYTDNILAV
jgi:hypothetical protein